MSVGNASENLSTEISVPFGWNFEAVCANQRATWNDLFSRVRVRSDDYLEKQRFYNNIETYRKKIILRPEEISNNGEVVRRIGVIGMNTALEMDIYGHVNSTHVTGTKMMNGIGGSGDFARNAYLSCFFCHSTTKHGDISAVVPMCSHVDHTEHDTHVFISEQGIADVRGLTHPDYRDLLMDYYERACAACGNSQTPHILKEAFAFHERLAETGSMKLKK